MYVCGDERTREGKRAAGVVDTECRGGGKVHCPGLPERTYRLLGRLGNSPPGCVAGEL